MEEKEVVTNTNVTENVTSIVKQEEPKPIEVPQQQTEFQIFGDNWRMATQLAKSDIIPENYKNKPQNVIIAVGMAQKMGMDYMTVMQNLNIVKGKTAWSGSFCRTLIEKSGKFGEIDLVFVGEQGKDDYGCKVVTTRKSDGKVIEGPLVDIKMAKSEGWTSNKKWTSMPQLMLSYRAMSYFARVNCPEALNGIYTAEEVEDVQQAKIVVEDVL